MQMLRTIRKAKGLTMKELGEKVGVSESAISQYETGKREADFETLLKLGEILDCSVDYILRGGETKKSLDADESAPRDEQERQIMGLVRQMSPVQKDFLIALLNTTIARNQEMPVAGQVSVGAAAPEFENRGPTR